MPNNVLDKVKNFYFYELPKEIVTYNIKVEGNVNNKENMSFVNAMASTYAPPKYRVKDVNFKSNDLFKFNQVSKFYWDILLRKNKVEFYLTLDEHNEDAIINKVKSSWNRCKVSKVNILEDEMRKLIDTETTDKCSSGELVLKTFNYKTLSTDMTNQYPLTNMLSIIKALKDDEYVRVNICIEPTSRLNWIDIAKDEQKQFKEGKIVNNEITLEEQMIKLGMTGVDMGLDLYLEYKLFPLKCMFGMLMDDDLDLSVKKEKKKTKDKIGKYDYYTDDVDIIESLSSLRRKTSSNYKSTAETFKTKITILSHSNDIDRARVNMISTSNAYKDITDENELVLKLHNDKETENTIEELKFFDVKPTKKCMLCDREICKLIQLPQKSLQDEYKIDAINTRESDIPKQLIGGNIRICEVDEPSKNRKTKVTFPTDSNLLCRKLVLIGGENSGKTTQLGRLSHDFYEAGVSNFIIDHQENGKLTDSISKTIPTNMKIIYDVFNNMPPLAFTEIQSRITEDMDDMTRLDYANMIAKQVELFVNSITDDTTGNLTGRMKRFLHSACMIVFIKPKTTINDVFTVLNNYTVRNEYLKYARYSNLFDKDDDVFIDMEELHRYEKGKIVGTRDDLIVGITNRITTIKQNPRIKQMLKKPYDENDNIDKYIQQGKSIFIKIPQNKFPDDDTRDMLAVFYFSRLWLTVQMREENRDSKICHCVLDEIKALPVLASFMEKHITEFRRHRLALTISCHGLAQFGKLLTQLTDSGASFIIMPPCDRKNLEALKEEMKPFTIEECMGLKPYHALCIINYGNQYWKGIGKMYKE